MLTPDSKRLDNKRNHASCRFPLRLAAVCTALLTLFLGACRIDTTIEFKADGSAQSEILVEDDTGTMQKLNSTCDELKTVASSARKFLADAQMEDVTLSKGHLACKLTSTTSPDDISFSSKSNTYSIKIEPSNGAKRNLDGTKITTTIKMPGRVIKSTVGTIEGNEVTIDGLDYIYDGFTIVAEKESSGRTSGASHSSSRSPQVSGVDESSGLPVWAWVSIAVGGIVCILGIIAITQSRKRRNTGAPGPQLYGGHGPDTGPWQPPYQQ